MDAVRVIKVPDVGEGIAEVELVAWHVQAGDVVAEDQALADVMTDKASVEIPAPVAGTVLALGGAVGQMLAVGSELIRIQPAGTAPQQGAPTPAAAVAGAPATASASAPVSAPVSAPMAAALAQQPPARSPSPSRAASTDTSALPLAPVTSASSVAPGAAAVRPIASPAVRRRAWELGIDLQVVPASGTAGRIMQADLEAFLAVHGAGPGGPGQTPPTASAPAMAFVTPPAAAPSPAPGITLIAGVERLDEQAVPVIGLRRRIALQMQESKRRIPHFSYVEEVDVTELEALRKSLNERHGAARGRLTLLPLLMRALVLALREHPQINARFDDEAGVVTRYGAVHMGVATDTRHGLMVPVLRHAEARSVWAMAAELARLAEAARNGRATRAELSGSTITLSSLGALGGIVSTPVINRPEVAIVAVNRIVERPVARAGSVVLRQLMNLSSSFDHRVVDGIDAARFVQAVRVTLESPGLLFAE